MVIECWTIPPSAPTPSYWLGHPSSCMPTQPWKPSHPFYQHTDAWQTHRAVFWFGFGHHDGGSKVVFDDEVIQPFCLQLDLGHGGLVDASFGILHQPGADEKNAKRTPVVDSFACIHPPWSWKCPNLGWNFAGLSSQSFFSPVWCCFPNSKGTELFWVALILIFCTLFFLCFLGHKNLQSCKITYWMTFISFIFNFPRDLNNALAKHKILREVKNKGYYHHPINNYYWKFRTLPKNLYTRWSGAKTNNCYTRTHCKLGKRDFRVWYICCLRFIKNCIFHIYTSEHSKMLNNWPFYFFENVQKTFICMWWDNTVLSFKLHIRKCLPNKLLIFI